LALLPDPRQLPAAALVRALNHLLQGQPWLRERLQPHAGRACLLEVFPFTLRLRIGLDGSLVLENAETPTDCEIRLSPVALARLLAGDERARGDIALVGDAALAAALSGVLQELRWDAEEDLSHLVGDIAARRMVQAAHRAAGWPATAARSAAANLSEYLMEERPMLARKDDVVRWAQEVDALRDAAERLEKRVLNLEQRRTSR
jgi:ubiquinone biosynthesis accessory factor UbiJ